MSKNKFLPLIGIILIFLILFLMDYKEQSELKENKISTTGKIIKIKSKYQARYSLVYEYYVNDKKYEGSVGITPFDCDSGKRGCVGSEFTVYYSSINPENSRIDLGMYEEFKTTVEFVK
jgi:hypothetical protein